MAASSSDSEWVDVDLLRPSASVLVVGLKRRKDLNGLSGNIMPGRKNERYPVCVKLPPKDVEQEDGSVESKDNFAHVLIKAKNLQPVEGTAEAATRLERLAAGVYDDADEPLEAAWERMQRSVKAGRAERLPVAFEGRVGDGVPEPAGPPDGYKAAS